ncbi:hypothetical protein CPB84DRAFT_1770703 [Gymnopilus junonius]|uniref:EF-hand domain-containing protein n=1 Tax=Gymnopilus junonius TaxID=109634 RepID=A0A9P5NR03_GYMJU|nr:hypothetical protein CPB84DRAFT_1770703 [Gymnopilus junonius]
MYNSAYTSRQQSQYYTPPSRTPEPRYGAQRQSGGNYTSFQHAHGPPPGADPQLWQWFASVDTDRSGSITVTELQSALVNGAIVHT